MKEYESIDFNKSRKRESEPTIGSKQRKSRNVKEQFIDNETNPDEERSHERDFINKNDPKKEFITPNKAFSDDSDPAEHLKELEKSAKKEESFDSITCPKDDIGSYRNPKGHFKKEVVDGTEIRTWVSDK
ncbi:hypothetical protein KKG58_03975 [Patescibacteria group bacterium]|nr:hypothetical protein [Patescibacteria group bacterium]